MNHIIYSQLKGLNLFCFSNLGNGNYDNETYRIFNYHRDNIPFITPLTSKGDEKQYGITILFSRA